MRIQLQIHKSLYQEVFSKKPPLRLWMSVFHRTERGGEEITETGAGIPALLRQATATATWILMQSIGSVSILKILSLN